MKKAIIIFIAFIFCFQLAGYSQSRVGLTGGIEIANLSRTIGGQDKDGDYRIGIAGGMLVDMPFGKKKKFSFQPSVEYVQKGAAEKAQAPVNKQYTALRYAELFPGLVYNMKSGKTKASTFYIGVGPFVDFNLPSKKVSHIPGNNIETDVSFGDQVANDFRGIDYGGRVILGYRTAMGIFVSLDYTQGGRNLAPVDNGDKIKSIAFGIRLGYLFKSSSMMKK
jgi:hypothetical protein